ncbi:uncharacterized protein F4807DRAFT_445525 [Annulohypoxylon truncatum]|uniref:uncharacterized protein n=1 Tax=Annulohypoxylon truncatum TaxID=327061 RepID=UPI002007A72C|nr:uncharacterized protein F4807DRAFT_445525 [Annulohypoxylon truncatum]KAI1204900.1 hypothetical protein F4807DRAFT_445525 [Annulohypoxylon truncatum]
MVKIEEYRPGYPRYTALLSSYPSWFIFRRFDKLRARLLLLKQDRLSRLEQQLEQIDQQETSPLFLGVSRCDRNADRLSTLSEIEAALIDYDQLIEHTNRILNLQLTERRDIESLQNWVDATGCLSKDETAYLSYPNELVCLVPVLDSVARQFETWVEDKLVRYLHCFRRNRFHDLSSDPNVYIYTGLLIRRTAKALLVVLTTLLLMLPVVICNVISIISVRITVIVLATVSYLLILSYLVKSRTMELILGGATYATILIVFVSGTT